MKRRYHEVSPFSSRLRNVKPRPALPTDPVPGFTPPLFEADGGYAELWPIILANAHPVWQHNLRLVNRWMHGVVQAYKRSQPAPNVDVDVDDYIIEACTAVTIHRSLEEAEYFILWLTAAAGRSRTLRWMSPFDDDGYYLRRITTIDRFIPSQFVRHTIRIATDIASAITRDRSKWPHQDTTVETQLRALASEMREDIFGIPPLVQAAIDSLAQYALQRNAWPATPCPEACVTVGERLLIAFYRAVRRGLS